jgi:outer membrane beta-barrel protein
MKNLLLITLLTFTSLAAKAVDLQSELKTLDVSDSIPINSNNEKLYVIQPRAMELARRIEILAGGGQDFTGDGFLLSRQLTVEGQYHFDDRWSVSAAYSNLRNQFNSSAQNLVNSNGLVPDVDYTLSRFEVRAVYNLFYGKIRFTKDSATYFDQYVGVGLVNNQLSSGQNLGPVAEIGFAHWLGNWGSLRWGLKDYYVNEQSQLSSGNVHNLFGVVEVGYFLR